MRDELEIYLPSEVAKLLGVSLRTVRNLISNGKLDAFNLSDDKAKRKHLRLTASSINKFIENQSLGSHK